MQKTSLRNRLFDSNRPITLLIAVVLMAVYAYAIADFFARAPSTEMSREVKLTETGCVHSDIIRTHLITMPSPDGKTASILAADGISTRLLEIDVRGNVLSETTLDIDLSRSKNIVGYYESDSRITVFFDGDSLNRLDIDRTGGAYRERIIEPEVESFSGIGSHLVIEKSDGLYGFDADGDHGLKLISAGPVLYYEIDVTRDDITIVSVIAGNGDQFDLRLVRCDRSFEVMQDLLIMDDSSDDHYRKLQAVQVQGQLTAMLFVFRDDKYGRNYPTVRRIRRDTGEFVDEFQTHVPILNSRYALIGGDAGSTSFLMRYRTVYGYNLIKCTLSETGDPVYTELTKTRSLSSLSRYFDIDGHKGLVFSDISDGRRSIFYTTDHPDVMAATTRLAGAHAGYVLAVTVINTIPTLFIGAIYLFMISIVPFLVVAGLEKIRSTNRYRNFILSAVGAILYTGLKLYVTYFVIHKTPNYQFQVPWIGGEPHIYIVLLVMSAISYGLIVRFLRSSADQEHAVLGLFFQFLLIDSIQYSLGFILYGVTTLLINKI